MRVITWNLDFKQPRSRRNEAWAYLRDELAPDLALLQEVADCRLLEGEYMLLKTVPQGWGTAILTRNIPMKEQAFSGYPGRVAVAELQIASTQRLVAVSVHAPIMGKNRRVFPYLSEMFDQIEEIVKGRTFIVGGDLNTARLAEKVWPGHGHGPFFERLSKSIFFDCFQKFHDKEKQTIFHPGGKHPFQDDHIFTSHDLADRVESCDVIDTTTTRRLSDHIPVIAEISL
ncbi:MAG: endonuclease/exonuclease/phosphatase family protein [Candidatus Bathyarchaeota archaeon]|nr:endonuclease/exonuclease/phosphatase family protein [Candidatus Bathyarchaeota archaeon]